MRATWCVCHGGAHECICPAAAHGCMPGTLHRCSARRGGTFEGGGAAHSVAPQEHSGAHLWPSVCSLTSGRSAGWCRTTSALLCRAKVCWRCAHACTEPHVTPALHRAAARGSAWMLRADAGRDFGGLWLLHLWAVRARCSIWARIHHSQPPPPPVVPPGCAGVEAAPRRGPAPGPRAPQCLQTRQRGARLRGPVR